MTQDYLNWTRHTIAWFKQAHDKGELQMRPPFQRNPVWKEAQKAYLLDSVLRGFPIPEVYLQESVDSEGLTTTIVVDGQQRIRSCLEFVEGRFPLDPEKSPEWGEATFEDLAPELKKRIFNYSFVVRLMPDVPEDALRKIFARLNQNVVALNEQELRHATYWGPFITTMEEISDWDFWSWAGIFTANDVRRMLDVEYISELATAHIHGLQNKKRSLDKFYGMYEENGFEDRASLLKTFQRVTGEMEALLPSLRTSRWRKKSDFYTLFLLLASIAKKLPLSSDSRTDLSDRLRDFAKRVDTQIRTGSDKSKTVREYSEAVERAASDLTSRKARQEALADWLKESASWPGVS